MSNPGITNDAIDAQVTPDEGAAASLTTLKGYLDGVETALATLATKLDTLATKLDTIATKLDTLHADLSS